MPYVSEFYLRYDYSNSTSLITSSKIEGIVIFMHSDGKAKGSFWRTITSGAIWPSMKIGRTAMKNIQVVDKYLDKKRRELVPAKHWHLLLLAVDPQHQGKGYASKLLEEMFSRIDEDGLPCYLETGGEKNVSMYQHFGFKVLEEFTEPNTTDKMVAMLREPKGGKK